MYLFAWLLCRFYVLASLRGHKQIAAQVLSSGMLQDASVFLHTPQSFAAFICLLSKGRICFARALHYFYYSGGI